MSRQLSIKITANSLYGQDGAKTSTFYDEDIAASTTATGRKLLIYAKEVIEACYDNTIEQTENYGKVMCLYSSQYANGFIFLPLKRRLIKAPKYPVFERVILPIAM